MATCTSIVTAKRLTEKRLDWLLIWFCTTYDLQIVQVANNQKCRLLQVFEVLLIPFSFWASPVCECDRRAGNDPVYAPCRRYRVESISSPAFIEH